MKNPLKKPEKNIYESGSCSGHETYIVEIRTKDPDTFTKDERGFIEWSNEWTTLHLPHGKSEIIFPDECDHQLPKAASTMTKNTARCVAYGMRAIYGRKVSVRIRRCILEQSWKITKDDDAGIEEIG